MSYKNKSQDENAFENDLVVPKRKKDLYKKLWIKILNTKKKKDASIIFFKMQFRFMIVISRFYGSSTKQCGLLQSRVLFRLFYGAAQVSSELVLLWLYTQRAIQNFLNRNDLSVRTSSRTSSIGGNNNCSNLNLNYLNLTSFLI